jgi:hypothetical protein
MAIVNNEEIFIHRDGQRFKLEGIELETFFEQRAKDQVEFETHKAQEQIENAQKTAILERLGLTEEELKIILN